MPRVSIVMTVYNGQAYIEEAVKSALAQTMGDFELIVVDDGSTDKSIDQIRQIKDERIKIIQLGLNSGRGAARNVGVRESSGEYIAIFDADDISLPNRLEKQVAYLDKYQKLGVVSGQIEHFEDGKMPRRLYNYPIRSAEVSNWFDSGMMAIPHCACMMRRSCFAFGEYDLGFTYIEDLEFFMRLSRHIEMVNLPDTLVYYRNNKLERPMLADIAHNQLHHGYTVYVANSKIAGQSYINFQDWQSAPGRLFFYKLVTWWSYVKLRIKLAFKH